MASPDDPIGSSSGPSAAPASIGSSPARIAWFVALTLLLLYLVSMFVPWDPQFPPGQIDVSWCMALHWAFIHHVDFANQFVFTFGPWGFLWQGYDPATYGLMVMGWMLFAGAFFTGAFTIARHAPLMRWQKGIWLALVIGIAGAPIRQGQDVKMMALSWLLMLIHFYVGDRPLLASKSLLVIAMALAGWVKFTVFLMGWSAVIVIGIEMIHRRKWPWPTILFAVFSVVFWMLAGQRLGALIPYVQHSMEISTAYSAAEAISQPTETRDVLMFLLVAVPLLVLVFFTVAKPKFATAPTAVILRERLSRLIKPALATLGFSCGIFIAFKSGYVRHDGHEVVATTSLALIALLLALVLWPALNRFPAKIAMSALVLASIALCSWSDSRMMHLGLPGYLWAGIRMAPQNGQSALQWISGNSSQRERHEQNLAQTRAAFPLPRLHGTVDIFSWQQNLLLCNQLTYRPRPVIQSYLTITPNLAKLNADFLRGPDAPDFILFDIQTIDERFPALDDSQAWPVLLTHYDLRDVSGPILVLEHSHEPRTSSLAHLLTMRTTLNHWIAVPPSREPVWVTIKFPQSTLQSLVSMAYKPAVMNLIVKTQDGVTHRTRIVPEMAAGGFLLSPMIRTRNDFARLWSSHWNEELGGALVTDISLSREDGFGAANSSDPANVEFSYLLYAHWQSAGETRMAVAGR